MSTDDLRRRLMERKLAERSGTTAGPPTNTPAADGGERSRRQRLLGQREQSDHVVEDPNQLVSDETAARLKAAGDLAARVGRGSLALSRGVAQSVVEKTREVRAERATRPKRERSGRLPWILASVAVLVLIGGGAWWWTSREEKPEPAKPIEMTMPVVPVAAPVYTPPAQTEPAQPDLPEVEPVPAEEVPAAPVPVEPAPAPEVVPEPLFIPSPTVKATPREPVMATPAPAPKPAVAQIKRAPPKVAARDRAQIQSIQDWGKQQQATRPKVPTASTVDPDLAKKSQAMDKFFSERQTDK